MKRLLIISAILVLALSLAACSNNANPPSQTENAGETTGAPSENTTQETVAEETAAETTSEEKKPDKYALPDPSKYDFFKVFEASDEAPRDAVINYMRKMATIEWTPAEEWTTIHKNEADNASLNLNHLYVPGKTYYGVPYANTGNSLDGFLSVLEDGKFTPNSPYYTELIGNHCSSSMDRAFEQIVDINGFGGILPEWIPDDLMYPIGSGIEAPEGWTNDTRLIAEHSGKDKMYAGYAALDKGDILYYTAPSGGHTRMVSGINLVKSAVGKILYDKSTISVIEQTNAWYTTEKNTTWFVDKKYTFNELFTKGFIPVTLKVYHDESFVIPDGYIAFEGKNTPETLKKNSLVGTVSSNFSFSYVRVTIKDSNGKIVLQDAEYQNINKKIIPMRSLYLDVKTLPKGTYTFNLRAGIAKGGCDIQTFDFTID